MIEWSPEQRDADFVAFIRSSNKHQVTQGRGTGPSELPGNRRLRGICQELAFRYKEASPRERKRLVLIVIATTNRNGSQFLKGNGRDGVVMTLQEQKIRVGQRLRDETKKATFPIVLDVIDIAFVSGCHEHATSRDLRNYIAMASQAASVVTVGVESSGSTRPDASGSNQADHNGASPDPAALLDSFELDLSIADGFYYPELDALLREWSM